MPVTFPALDHVNWQLPARNINNVVNGIAFNLFRVNIIVFFDLYLQHIKSDKGCAYTAFCIVVTVELFNQNEIFYLSDTVRHPAVCL